MANIKGGGAKGRNLVGTATYFDGKTDEKGKKQAPFYMVDAQLDLRDPANEPKTQSNPHLESHSFVSADGKERTAHGIRMTVGQVEAIKAGAGDGNFMAITEDGRSVEFAVKADLMSVARNDGRKTLLINTKSPMEASDYGWNPDMMKNQGALKAEAKQAVAAEKAAKAAAKQAEGPVAAPKAATKSTKKKSAAKPKAKAAEAPAVEAPSADAEFEA